MTLFLDANAHLAVHPKAIDAYVNFNRSVIAHGNPMSHGFLGRKSSSELEVARAKIANLIGAKHANQIVFTSTGTQACEWGLELLKAQKFSKVYTSTVEHKSVSVKSRELFGNNDLFITKDGVVSCSFVPEKNSAFVCIHVQNELGTIQRIEDIKVPFFSDMSQSIGKIPVNVSSIPNLKVAAFGAHKFGGPASVGILYLQDTKWWKEFGTGSRYFFDRTGTPDVGMIVSTAVALEESLKTLPSRYEKALLFRSILEDTITKKGAEILGMNASRIPHTTFVRVGNRMASYIMTQLEAEGIYVGLGSACGSLHSNSNPIATALGYAGSVEDYLRISQYGDYGENEARKVAFSLSKYL